MSALVLCPDCKRKLKVPDSAVGKTIRCPSCKAPIPPLSEPRLSASDPENDEPDAPSPRRSVKTAPPSRTAPRGQLNRDEDMEDDDDDDAPAVEKPIRKKSSGKRQPSRKKSSAGPIIGLAVGGVLVLIVLVGIGVGLLRYVGRIRTIPEAEWRPFSPPNGGCTLLMPGTPVLQSNVTNLIPSNMYVVERDKGNTGFMVAILNLGTNPLQPGSPELIFNAQREGMTRGVEGKVTNEFPITLGNISGREFHIVPSKIPGLLIERVYLVKMSGQHRCYAVIASGENIVPNKGDAARFFDSFKLDASATPPTLADPAAPFGPQQPPVANPPPANPGPMPPQVNPQPQPPQQQPRFPRFPRRVPGMP